ncbi:MAG: hypothetical protein C0594_12870, partial [Marinilabiliales bacterium]
MVDTVHGVIAMVIIMDIGMAIMMVIMTVIMIHIIITAMTEQTITMEHTELWQPMVQEVTEVPEKLEVLQSLFPCVKMNWVQV